MWSCLKFTGTEIALALSATEYAAASMLTVLMGARRALAPQR